MSDTEVSKEAETPALVAADSSTEKPEAKTETVSKDKELNGAPVEQASAATPDPVSSKSDDKVLSSLEEKIVRQIEYYFGDRNLPRDKFLQQAISEGKDNYVPIKTLLTFNRLKALSSDGEFIAQAMLKSSNSVVQVSDDKLSVRRSPDLPLPDIFSLDVRMLIKDKSIYMKGFPEDTVLDKIQTFLAPFGKIEHIQMRRYTQGEDRKFKGSIFVEFDTKETAEEIASKELEFEGNKLLIETKENYMTRKTQERKLKKGGAAKNEATADEPEKTTVLTPNSVMHFKGCGPDASWNSIKEALNEFSTVAYVDFTNNERTEGYVRFNDEGGAILASKGLNKDNKPILLGEPSEIRVVEGEEEIEYWAKKDKDARLQGKRKGKSSFKHGSRPKRFKREH